MTDVRCYGCGKVFDRADKKTVNGMKSCPECHNQAAPDDEPHADGLPILAQDPCLWWWLDGKTL